MNKQIQEMAVLGCKRNPQAYAADECGKCIFKHGSCNAYSHAEALYSTGYRKIPEDSVVLSREEYEKLKSLYDCEQGSYMTSQIGNLPLTVEGLRKAVDEITRLNRVEAELQELNAKYYNEAKDLRREFKQASKETVEKILKDVQKKITQLRLNGHLSREQDIRLSRFLVGKAQDYGIEVEIKE